MPLLVAAARIMENTVELSLLLTPPPKPERVQSMPAGYRVKCAGQVC